MRSMLWEHENLHKCIPPPQCSHQLVLADAPVVVDVHALVYLPEMHEAVLAAELWTILSACSIRMLQGDWLDRTRLLRLRLRLGLVVSRCRCLR
jgi:hypothetical protein